MRSAATARRLARLILVLGLMALVPAAPAAARDQRATLGPQIETYKHKTWRLQKLMGKPTTRASKKYRLGGVRYQQWVRDLWQGRYRRAQRQAENPPHLRQWLCIHRHERHPSQGWRTNTGNGYYGGLQMDIRFQRYFAPSFLLRKGTADRWSAVEQMWVAERAYRITGFSPWPNTARACGLL